MPRGGKRSVKGVNVPKKVVIEDDVPAVLADQRVCPGKWSKNYINRAVLVASPIRIDSNASIKEKRPRYFTATEGEQASFFAPRVYVIVPSLQSCTIQPNTTDVKLCVYTARDVLKGECQVLHTSRASIYSKMLEDALQTAIHKAPLPMRMRRQPISMYFIANCSP